MKLIFAALQSMIGSAGWSIVLLALLMTVITHPIRGWAQKTEARTRSRMQNVDTEVATATVGMKGEKKFRAVERIYNSHGYHPIHSVALGTSLFVMLPVLVSALFIFNANEKLVGEQFLFVKDLSLPDGLAWGVNILPILMTGITLIDSKIRFADDYKAIMQFLFVALVMFVLVYTFAAAIVIFWITCNLFSILTYVLRHVRE